MNRKFTAIVLHALVIAGAIVIIFVVVLLLSYIWLEIGSPLRKALLNAGLSDRTVGYISLLSVWMIPDSLGYFLGGLFCGICLKRNWWVSALIAAGAVLFLDNIILYRILRAAPDLPNQGLRSIIAFNSIQCMVSLSLAVLGSAIPSILRRSRRKG